MIKKLGFLSLMVMSLLLFSCEGDPGPAGPAGVSDVNVIVFDRGPADWSGNADGYTLTLDVPEITGDIYESGAVLVYELHENGNANDNHFNMLPYTEVIGTQITYLDFDTYVGQIIIKSRWVDNGVNTTQAPSGSTIFKVVIIQGTNISTIKKNAPLQDYNATLKYLYNLKKKNF